MPHQCVHCSEIYGDAAAEILKGCSKCNGRFFFYLSEERLKKIKESQPPVPELEQLDAAEKKQIELDVREIAGIEEEEAPVILDFESVKIVKPGKYLLDISNLFSKERPLIYKLEDGKYVIDLSSQLKGKEA